MRYFADASNPLLMRQLKITRSITQRESPSLEKYLQEISREDLLTSEEEVALAKRIREGDTDALEKLTKANLRFVVSVAKQYQNQGLSLSDLINEGNLGLIKATERFDETKGFKFISYAVWWIRQSILQALAEQSRIVRLPLNKVGSLNKINKAFAQLEQEFEREPTPEELADILHWDLSEVRNTMSIGNRHISVDAPFPNQEENTLLDVLTNNNGQNAEIDAVQLEAMQVEIERSLNLLNERQAEVVRMYFGIGYEGGMSLEDIGQRYNLTRERVRQIRDKALSIIKESPRSVVLREYFRD